MNSVVPDAKATSPSRWNSSMRFDVWSSVHNSSTVEMEKGAGRSIPWSTWFEGMRPSVNTTAAADLSGFRGPLGPAASGRLPLNDGSLGGRERTGTAVRCVWARAGRERRHGRCRWARVPPGVCRGGARRGIGRQGARSDAALDRRGRGGVGRLTALEPPARPPLTSSQLAGGRQPVSGDRPRGLVGAISSGVAGRVDQRPSGPRIRVRLRSWTSR